MDYNALKVADLKVLLKERGIPSTGLSRKQQIVDALDSEDTKNQSQSAANEGDAEGQAEEAASGVAVEPATEQAVEGESENDASAREAEASQVQSNDNNVAVEQNTESSTLPTDATVQASQPTADSAPAEALDPDPPSTEPTILESNRPVSKEPSAFVTPRQTSPVEDTQSSDRKRKRRSLTPPVDEESVSKKLKAADDAPAVVPGNDVAMEDLAEPATPSNELSDALQESSAQEDTAPEAAAAPALDHKDGPGDQPNVANATVERSIHPATRAVYIRNLIRPIQQTQLQEHLTQLAIPPSGDPAESRMELLHLGSIRTHAFAIFNSISAASRARAGLHDRIWPDEPARKQLWVDFVPEDKVSQWIDRETEGGGGRRDTRRWEIVYDETDDEVVARHEEVTSSSAPGMPERRPSSIGTAPAVTGQGLGMPNAPLGPRGDRPSTAAVPPAQQVSRSPPPPEPTSTSFVVLDERFPSTSTKPKLYYLPVAKDLAERRRDEIERQTSREWDARGGELRAGADVRRYTFEDGDRLVDGGPHFGDFSGPRGGGGRGRRGGFRGR